MGEGVLSRTIFSVNLQRTYALLAGEREPLLPDYWSTPSSNSDRHLAVLHILLRSKLDGKITDAMLSVVKKTYRDQPSNGLFSFAYHMFEDGDQSSTIKLITDLYPNTTCKPWLWSEPKEKWVNCNQANTQAEFLFLIHLLKESQNGNLK